MTKKLSHDQFVELVVSNQDVRVEIIDQMERFGGSFVKALAKCLLHADPFNRQKLVQTFYNYIFEYAHFKD